SAPGPSDTLSHTFLAGPQMISLPIQPFHSDLALVLGTDRQRTLLAQYRQDLNGSDKYLRYPTLPLYQPGYALWSDFATSVAATSIQGQRTDIQSEISIAAQFGWNQIA